MHCSRCLLSLDFASSLFSPCPFTMLVYFYYRWGFEATDSLDLVFQWSCWRKGKSPFSQHQIEKSHGRKEWTANIAANRVRSVIKRRKSRSLLEDLFFFKKKFYFVLEYSQLTNNVVIVSNEQQRDSAIYIHSPPNSPPIQAAT